jgi:hypothetical protein
MNATKAGMSPGDFANAPKLPAHRYHVVQSLVNYQSHFISLIMAHNFPPLSERPVKNTLVLFDVDGTLTPARKVDFPNAKR